MVQFVEATGNTVEEALENALKKANIKLEEARYEVLSINPPKVRVFIDATELDFIEDTIRALLEKLGAIKPQIMIEVMEQNKFYINIRTKNLDSFLIGREGKILRELSHLISVMLKKHMPDATFIVDVASYKRRRERYLINKAIATAKLVKQTGLEYTLDPMEASERNKVKEALSKIEGIRVYMVGRGKEARLVIAPLDKKQE